MPKGGVREGAGRPKGSLNKATAAQNAQKAEVLQKAIAEGITPLEVMLQSMRSYWEENNREQACAIAKDAAPYVHPKLAAIEQNLNAGKGLKRFTLTVEGGEDGDD